MIFRIGPWVYRVRITDDALHDEQGKECLGLPDWRSKTIWLAGAAQLPVRRRPETLCHELKHVWQTELGHPANDEDDANQSASFTVDVWTQLERQGGAAALMRLTADGIIDRAADVDDDLGGESRSPTCGQCGGHLEQPTRYSAPAFDAGRGKLVSWGEADCEFCGITVRWPEAVTSRGLPTGNVLGAPTISRQTSDGSCPVICRPA